MNANDHMPDAGYTSRISLGMVIIAVLSICCFMGLYTTGQAEAAVNVLSYGTAVDGSALAYTAPNGTNRVVVAFVTADSSTTSVTIGGTAATLLAENTGINNNMASAWYRVIGDGSGENMDVSAATGSSPTVSVVTFGGVDQSSPIYSFDATDSSSGAAPAPVIVVPDGGRAAYIQNSNSDNGVNDTFNPPTNGGTWTEFFDFGAASNRVTAGYRDAITAITGLSVNTTDTSTATNRGSMVAFSLNPSSATAPAGITVNPTSGLTTTEAGGSDTFTIVLDSAPTANVTIGLSSSNTAEGTVAPSSVTFTTANWNTPQTVTVTGVDDAVVDGNVSYTIVTAAATSTDSNYSGLDASDVSVTNIDNDVAGSPGITVNPTSGLTTTEAGGTATFTIVLDSAPTANVTIGLSSSDTTEGTVSPSSITFTTGNWSSPLSVTVTGVDDLTVDGNISYTIVTAAATSADGNYSGLNASDVSVTNTDNDGTPPAVPVGNWPLFIMVIVGIITYGLVWRRKQGKSAF